jgi:hypothetical protein
MISTLHSPLGALVVGLAHAAALSVDQRTVLAHAQAFEDALDAFDADAPLDELTVASQRVYFAAIVLVNAVDRFADRAFGLRLRRTVMKTFVMLDLNVGPAERALLARLVGDPPEEPRRAFAQA